MQLLQTRLPNVLPTSIKWRSLKSDVQLLNRSSKVIRIILLLNKSINHTVKFVYGHTEAFMQISRGNCITDQIEDLTLNINAP